MPSHITPELKDFLLNIFVIEPDKRLGGGEDGAAEIKNHPWFKNIDWNFITEKKIKPPFRPQLKSNQDTSYIDSAFTK